MLGPDLYFLQLSGPKQWYYYFFSGLGWNLGDTNRDRKMFSNINNRDSKMALWPYYDLISGTVLVFAVWHPLKCVNDLYYYLIHKRIIYLVVPLLLLSILSVGINIRHNIIYRIIFCKILLLYYYYYTVLYIYIQEETKVKFILK